MRIASVKLTKFRRFEDLEIRDIPATAKLVVLAGPNGSGKSSLFDAFLLKYKAEASYGGIQDTRYYNRTGSEDKKIFDRIKIEKHGNSTFTRGSLYVRSAYRNEPDFQTTTITREGPILEQHSLARLIDYDAAAKRNYARLASRALGDVFVHKEGSMTMSQYRDNFVGEIRDPLLRLFPDLRFVGVGNPLEQGTFQFEKGAIKGFDYKNLPDYA